MIKCRLATRGGEAFVLQLFTSGLFNLLYIFLQNQALGNQRHTASFFTCVSGYVCLFVFGCSIIINNFIMPLLGLQGWFIWFYALLAFIFIPLPRDSFYNTGNDTLKACRHFTAFALLISFGQVKVG